MGGGGTNSIVQYEQYADFTTPACPPGPSVKTGKKKKKKKADSCRESQGDGDEICDDSCLRGLNQRGQMRML